ncbi:MAG: hypothetical protein R3B72_42370 [Polyangiaceae bacterium]
MAASSDEAPGEESEPERAPLDGEALRAGAERRRDMLAAWAVIALVVMGALLSQAQARFSPRPTEAACSALLERWVDLASRASDPAIQDRDVSQALAEARENDTRGLDVMACRTQLSAAQVECATRAHHVDEIERCLQ